MLIKNCGQGEYALLLALVKKGWQIDACDNDGDNIDTARHCVAVPTNLHYTTEEIEETGYDYVIDMRREDVETGSDTQGSLALHARGEWTSSKGESRCARGELKRNK